MPHDLFNRELEVGDFVFIPAQVVKVHANEDYCNADLDLFPMPPNTTPARMSAINTKQVFKVASKGVAIPFFIEGTPAACAVLRLQQALTKPAA